MGKIKEMTMSNEKDLTELTKELAHNTKELAQEHLNTEVDSESITKVAKAIFSGLFLEKRLASISNEVSWEIQAVFHFIREDIKNLQNMLEPKRESVPKRMLQFIKTTILSVALAICYATLLKALVPAVSSIIAAPTKSDSSQTKTEATYSRDDPTSSSEITNGRARKKNMERESEAKEAF
jgi:hypothetical protein